MNQVFLVKAYKKFNKYSHIQISIFNLNSSPLKELSGSEYMISEAIQRKQKLKTLFSSRKITIQNRKMFIYHLSGKKFETSITLENILKGYVSKLIFFSPQYYNIDSKIQECLTK